MRKVKIPTIIAIIVLTLGLSFSVILVGQKQLLLPKAKSQNAPQNVQISNITDSSFSVSWTTQDKSNGSIIWGKSKTSLNQTTAEETKSQGYTHFATIRNLEPQTIYYFKIISNTSTYDNNGTPWEIQTGSSLNTKNNSSIKNISGSVVSSIGTPVNQALVFAKIQGGSLLSTYTSENGNWIIPLLELRTEDLKNAYQPTGQELIEINVHAGPQGIASAQIYLQDANPTPIITLGQNFDFRGITTNKSEAIPTAEILAPEQATKQPKFNVNDYENTGISNNNVTIDSVNEGEVIYTTNPEFFGKAPPNKKITITVESEKPQTTTITANNSGVWRWSPPSGLTPGTHKITVTYRDENGILKSIVKTFVVQAAEANEPAFESTPSASISPTTISTSRPSSTPTPATTPTPTTAIATSTPLIQKTASPSATPVQPDSGFSLPTLILLVGGLLLFLGSAFLMFAN